MHECSMADLLSTAFESSCVKSMVADDFKISQSHKLIMMEIPRFRLCEAIQF